MCFFPDIPVLSPLPYAEIPPEQPTIESDEEESPIVGNSLRVDEYGREYYPHPRYADSDEVPENMRLYLDSDDEDMRSFLDGYNQYDEEEDEEELVPSEDEEQELPAKIDSPPPPHPQPVVPP